MQTAIALEPLPRKSLHRGSCQACGGVHKLPRGKLAKHGYTVASSAFHGTCRGSDELPFELTCARVRSFIERAHFELRALKALAASLLVPAVEPKAWVHEYLPHAAHGHSGGGYRWLETTIKQADQFRLLYVDSAGKAVRYPISLDFTDLFDACTKLNGQYRERVVLKDIARTQRYIVWQERRVAVWSLAPLLPLDPDKVPEQASFFDLDMVNLHQKDNSSQPELASI